MNEIISNSNTNQTCNETPLMSARNIEETRQQIGITLIKMNMNRKTKIKARKYYDTL